MSDAAWQALGKTKSGTRIRGLWLRLQFYTSRRSGRDVSALRADQELAHLVTVSHEASTVTAKKAAIGAVLDHVASMHGIAEDVLDLIPPWDMGSVFALDKERARRIGF